MISIFEKEVKIDQENFLVPCNQKQKVKIVQYRQKIKNNRKNARQY